MSKLVKLSGLAVCGAIFCAPAAFAQAAGSPAAPVPTTGANSSLTAPATATQARANTDVAASANTVEAPVVNPPDPQNAGTLAENVRTTALATYPWSTADTWFGTR